MKIHPDGLPRPTALRRPAPVYGPLTVHAHYATKALIRTCFAPFAAFRVEGARHVPKVGGFLLLPKHQHWVDIPYLGTACPRRLCYVAKAELFRTRLGQRFFTYMGAIPLDRRRPIATRHSLRAIRDSLRMGNGVVLFPEGTYVPGRMGDGRSSLLRYLIQNAPVPLIPVGIDYTVLAGRRTVTLRFGSPILPDHGTPVSYLINDLLGRIADLSGLGLRSGQMPV